MGVDDRATTVTAPADAPAPPGGAPPAPPEGPSGAGGAQQGPGERYLSPRHRAEQLHAAGLTDATIDASGFWTATDAAQTVPLIHWPEAVAALRGDCLMIPYFDYAGNPLTYTVARPDTPRPRANENGTIK